MSQNFDLLWKVCNNSIPGLHFGFLSSQFGFFSKALYGLNFLFLPHLNSIDFSRILGFASVLPANCFKARFFISLLFSSVQNRSHCRQVTLPNLITFVIICWFPDANPQLNSYRLSHDDIEKIPNIEKGDFSLKQFATDIRNDKRSIDLFIMDNTDFWFQYFLFQFLINRINDVLNINLQIFL